MKSYNKCFVQIWFFSVTVSLFVFACTSKPVYEFDVPEGPAEKTLKIFAEQAGIDIIFKNETGTEVKTKAVIGDMAAIEALNIMIKNTGLSYYRDESLNAIAVTYLLDSRQ